MSQTYPKFERPLVVLHVDDDPMNLRVVEEILVAFNHTAVKTTSGAEALSLLADQAFDVVLMDIHMPGMSGVETVERLRASSGPERNVPVIALTADVFSRRPEDYRALGFNDFVSKPILVSGLLDAIKRAAESPKGKLSAANAA
ncbi:response regulator [Phenylobacterium sp.]|uniref:response regulator n=1 Tax=Phenylobacterium sp. TaxID=1871053 RepID=UPI0011FF6616|nr:response regulator [Phenylobacterium sp.]THD67318.1 MAG: response regulator [Phenylobacterium sp.]